MMALLKPVCENKQKQKRNKKERECVREREREREKGKTIMSDLCADPRLVCCVQYDVLTLVSCVVCSMMC